MRRNQFTVDAESIQGNAEATVTFRCLKVREVRRYRQDPAFGDHELLEQHIMSWSGIVDDNDRELPNPADDPAVLDELYLHERSQLGTLLFVGPGGPNVKN